MSHVSGYEDYTFVKKLAPPPDGPFIEGVLTGAGLVRDTRGDNPPGTTIGDWVGMTVASAPGGTKVRVTITHERPELSPDLATAKSQVGAILAAADVAP
jgi:hypothetical protein